MSTGVCTDAAGLGVTAMAEVASAGSSAAAALGLLAELVSSLPRSWQTVASCGGDSGQVGEGRRCVVEKAVVVEEEAVVVETVVVEKGVVKKAVVVVVEKVVVVVEEEAVVVEAHMA
uniref:Uncharacterized protein n=1 Tax=Knipowitschia caucasica TaxID=637954 RepID=A0AAV2MQM2_KNICA